VRFALARDPDVSRFLFAPLQGPTARDELAAIELEDLPDSIIVLTPEGSVLLESAAVLYMLKRIGGSWGALGQLSAIVPRRIRDAAYRVIARWRHRFFAQPEDTCPVVPGELRARFLP
jgi:predicted DCC family thiol-disulfide oxidoreductase YuxK